MVTARMIVSTGERRFAPDCKDYWTPAHGLVPGQRRGGPALPILSAICKPPSSSANPSSACAALSQASARTAKKWWRDENVPTDLREAAQTHVEGDKVAAGYGGHAKMLARRRDLAERWPRFCAGPTEAK